MLLRQMSQGQELIACPAQCSCYVSRELAEAKAPREKRREYLVHITKAPFIWFAKLSWQAQVAIIAGFVLLVFVELAPQFLPAVIELVNKVNSFFNQFHPPVFGSAFISLVGCHRCQWSNSVGFESCRDDPVFGGEDHYNSIGPRL